MKAKEIHLFLQVAHCYGTYFHFTDLSYMESTESVTLPMLDLPTLKVAIENFAEHFGLSSKLPDLKDYCYFNYCLC
jgi:hypothetical protein